MNISNTSIQYIRHILNIAKLLKIPAVSLSETLIKGTVEGASVFILQKENIPSFNKLTIGINNIPVFLNRLDLVLSQPNFSVECTTVNTEEMSFVRSFLFKTNSTKIGFTCTSPKTIKSITIINDAFETEIQISDEVIEILKKGVKAMDAKSITLLNNEKETFIEFLDINNDVFKFILPQKASSTSNTMESFAFRYPADIFLSVVQNSSNMLLKIGNRGTLNTEIDNVNVFMVPQV